MLLANKNTDSLQVKSLDMSLREEQMPFSRLWKMTMEDDQVLSLMDLKDLNCPNPRWLTPPATFGVTSGPPQVDHPQSLGKIDLSKDKGSRGARGV